MGSKLRCIRSTPTETQAFNENDFGCFASTGVNAPAMAKTIDNRRTDRVRSSHGSRRGRNSNRLPFLGLHPRFTVPSIFLLIGTRVPAGHTRLWVAARATSDMDLVHSSCTEGLELSINRLGRPGFPQ